MTEYQSRSGTGPGQKNQGAHNTPTPRVAPEDVYIKSIESFDNKIERIYNTLYLWALLLAGRRQGTFCPGADRKMVMTAQVLKPEEYFITEEPYYESVGNEIEVFEAAYQNQLPVLL